MVIFFLVFFIFRFGKEKCFLNYYLVIYLYIVLILKNYYIKYIIIYFNLYCFKIIRLFICKKNVIIFFLVIEKLNSGFMRIV